MPADAELRIRAAVEQAIGALRQVKGEVAGVRAESKAASASQSTDAAKNVASTIKQREALVVLAREYGAVGASAKRGSAEAITAQRLQADATRRANAMLMEQKAATEKVASGHNILGKSMGILFGGALAAKGIEDIVDVAKEAQQSQVQLANTMHDAGQSYAAHKKQIEGAIEAESKLAGVQRVDLRTSFMNLDRLTGSTTKGIRDMGLATDIARARHMAMSQATKLVMMAEMGRVAMLRRMGIQLPTITTAEDQLRNSHAKVTAEVKRQAKEWDQQQTAIAAVAALHKAYAGSAESYGKTAAGGVDRLHVAWQDFGIELGNKLLPIIGKASTWLADEIDKLDKSKRAHELLHQAVHMVVDAYHEVLPIIKAVIETVKDVTTWLGHHATVAKILAGTIVALYTGYKIYTETVKVVTAVTKAWATVQKILNAEMALNPIGLVIVAIAALAAGIYLAYQHSATFRRIVHEVWAFLKEQFVPVLHAVKDAAVYAFDFIKKHWQLLLAIFGGPLGVIVGLVIKHFGDIADAVMHPVKTIKAAWSAIFTWLEKTAIDVALKIIEPFSHLPKWLGGGWAQDMKKNLQSALDGLNDPAIQNGTAAGTAYGQSFVSAATAQMAGMTGAVGTPNADAAAKGAHGSALAGRGPTSVKGGTVTQIARAAASSPGASSTSFHLEGERTPWDCSAFTQAVFRKAGIQIGGDTYAQYAGGRNVDKNDLQPDDLIFFNYPGERSPGHVGIYVGGGMMVHDHGQSGGVSYQPVDWSHYVGARCYSKNHNHAAKKGTPTNPDTAPSSQAWANAGGTAAPAAASATAKTAKGLAVGSVATMRQAVNDLQAKIKDILPIGLRDELEKRAAAILGGIQKGLGPEATAKLRSDLRKFSSDVSAALALDKAVEAAKAGMGKIKDEVAGLPASLRGPLKAELAQVSAEFGHIVNAKDLAAAKRDLADLKSAVAKAMHLDTAIEAARASMRAIGAQISGWPDDVKGPLQEQMAALSRMLAHVVTAQDMAAAKAQLAKLKGAISTAISDAKAATSAAQTVFEKEWGRYAAAALAAFDKVTAATIKMHKVTVTMGGYSFDYGSGDLTPAQKALQALQDKQAQDQRDQAAANAADQLKADQAALAAAQAVGVGGTDASGNVLAQSDIDALMKTVKADQQALDQTALDQRMSDLQKQADAEQTAAQDQLQTWTDAYQSQRDVQRQVLSDHLDDLKTAIEDQKITWNGAMDDIAGILKLGGDTAAQAFWDAFNAANDANKAAGGGDTTAAAKKAAADAAAAAAREAAITGKSNPSTTDPGQGTRPDDRGGTRGAGPSTPAFVWGGITWTKGDRAAFARWLTGHGANYATWADNHPDAAAMLAKGGLVTRPTLTMMGEKPGMRKGEGVIPLDDPRALAAIGEAIAAALPGSMGGVTAIFPNAIIPGRDRDAARRLARMAGPELSRTISYRTSP